MGIVQFLTADSVVAVAVPACVFLIGYAGTVWWKAKCRRARLRTGVYALTTGAALAIHLSWLIAAPIVSAIVVWAWSAGLDPAARTVLVAGDPSEQDYVAALAYLLAAVMWPIGWSLVAGVILLAARRALGPAARSVLAALLTGSLVVVVPLGVLNGAEVLAAIPDLARIGGVLAFVVTAVGIVVAAGRRSRVQGMDQTGTAAGVLP